MKLKKQTFILVLTAILFALSFSSCKKKGCLDIKASNFDAGAMVDDGSCQYGYTGGGGGTNGTLGFYKSSSFSSLSVAVYNQNSQYMGAVTLNCTNNSATSCTSSCVSSLILPGNQQYFYVVSTQGIEISNGYVMVYPGNCNLVYAY